MAANDMALALPEGYTTGKNKFYAEGVARRFDTLAPEGTNGGGTVRLLLVANKETTGDEVRELLGSPRFQLRQMGPGIWQATAKPRDMENVIGPNVGMNGMFRWVDLANRFYGHSVTGENDMATVAVTYDGAEGDAKKKLKSLGMTITEPEAKPDDVDEGDWVNPDEGLIVGTMKGGSLYDLALLTKAEAVEIRGVEKAGTKG